MQRGSGILLGISSLPGRYGIGTLGRGARAFLDRLHQSGQTYWQILPASPTGFGDSPYQAFSVFAGNPYFIDFEQLYADGLMPRDLFMACGSLFGPDAQFVDYGLQYRVKAGILWQAYLSCGASVARQVDDFAEQNAYWIHDFALYMALKGASDMKPYWDWPADIMRRDAQALADAAAALGQQIRYHTFVQYVYFKQWGAVRQYAKEKNVKIIGDTPIYMAPDSADAWVNSAILDKNANVAGCPPDYFSATGQLWGNPVYDWHALEQTGYSWWIRRIAHQLGLYDYLRIDHFRGFEAYYAIPAGEKTAEHGQWMKGPGMDFFRCVHGALGDLPLIAEDLGFLTQEVFDLLRQTGFPGLKVLQFAFDPSGGSLYLPHRYPRNCVVYTGTHDNDTIAGWYGGLGMAEKDFLHDYLGSASEPVHWQLIRLAMRSVADVCIIPMQDFLGLGSQARMNRPQTALGNWRWRLGEAQFDDRLAAEIKKLSAIYGRV